MSEEVETATDESAGKGLGLTRGELFRLGASAAMVGAMALEWELIDILTPLLMIPFMWLVMLLYGIAFIWCVVNLIRSRFARRSLAITGVALACGLAATFVPFTNLWLDWNFWRYDKDRDEIVRSIQNGTLAAQSDEPHTRKFVLPSGSAAVSKGGNEVFAQEHDGVNYVFFFTFRGILGHYSGFLFVEDGGDPRKFWDMNEKRTQVIQLRKNWFFIAHG